MPRAGLEPATSRFRISLRENFSLALSQLSYRGIEDWKKVIAIINFAPLARSSDESMASRDWTPSLGRNAVFDPLKIYPFYYLT
jgi:hypothetical protein